jgi:hypothetical protein
VRCIRRVAMTDRADAAMQRAPVVPVHKIALAPLLRPHVRAVLDMPLDVGAEGGPRRTLNAPRSPLADGEPLHAHPVKEMW